MKFGTLWDNWLKLVGAIHWFANQLVGLNVDALMVAAHRGQGALEETGSGKVPKRVIHWADFLKVRQRVPRVFGG